VAEVEQINKIPKKKIVTQLCLPNMIQHCTSSIDTRAGQGTPKKEKQQ